MTHKESRHHWNGSVFLALLLAVLLAPACALAATDSKTAEAPGDNATGPLPKPITPPEPAAIDEAIQRGVKFLVADQRPDGCWGSAEKTKGLNL